MKKSKQQHKKKKATTGMKECMDHLMMKRGYPAEQARKLCEAQLAK